MNTEDGDSVRINRPYAQSGTVFACVEAIVNTCLGVQLMLSRSDDQIIESGPAWEFLFNNRDLPLSELLTETIGLYTLSRQVYWITPDAPVGTPDELIVASSMHVKPVIRRGVIVGYHLLLPEGRRLPLTYEEVYTIKGFDPYKRIGIPSAVGPTTAGSASIGSSAMAAMYSESLFANSARPDGVLEHPGEPSEQDKQQLRADWAARHGGPKRAGRTALLTGGAKYHTIASTFAELEFTQFCELKATEICSVFGVPPEVVGLNSEAQYANGPAQQRFIINTIMPLLRTIASHITLGILNRFTSTSKGVEPARSKTFTGRPSLPLRKRGEYNMAKHKAIAGGSSQLFAWFNIDEHPTIRQMNLDRTATALKQMDYSIPLNDILDAYDLPFEHKDWGDIGFISAGKLPVSSLLEPPQPAEEKAAPADPPPAAEKKDKAAGYTAAQLQYFHDRFEAAIASHEKSYTSALRTYFLRQQRQVISAVEKNYTKAAFKSAQISKSDAARLIDIGFDVVEENGRLVAINSSYVYDTAQSGAESMYDMLDLDADARPPVQNTTTIADAVAAQADKIRSVNSTTRQALIEAVEEAINSGASQKELVTSLRQQFKLRLNSARSTARTMTASSGNAGRQAGMAGAGVQKKGWATAGSGEIRAAHMQAASDYAQGVPVSQPFIVGGEPLMYPGDPSGSAGNIINCRCMSFPIR
jgi:hypothetical protein